MRFVIQRVTEATCEVDQKITGQITNGFCVLIGICLLYTSPSPRDTR